ncbi:hypothetical protein [Limnohabitans sp.]|uniref:hypothetical protein n=1 Tax=Limnohabitans sp. TaxID=1907725 RepID=UPI0039BD3E5C|nr:hypothetical protein [Comamonadaceae bacterium]
MFGNQAGRHCTLKAWHSRDIAIRQNRLIHRTQIKTKVKHHVCPLIDHKLAQFGFLKNRPLDRALRQIKTPAPVHGKQRQLTRLGAQGVAIQDHRAIVGKPQKWQNRERCSQSDVQRMVKMVKSHSVFAVDRARRLGYVNHRHGVTAASTGWVSKNSKSGFF